jgi:energy-coupling factor transport system ATP-binding protein
VSLRSSDAGFVYGQGAGYEQRALEDVSLEVRPRELALVLGATGSGKSTLLRLCAGLLTPTSGTVEVDGVSTTGAAGRTLRGRVGLVFQNPEAQLFAESVLEDVAFGPRNLGASAEEARQAAADALGAVGLDPDAYGSRSPFALSGGEARRVAVAGVLAMKPAYLLLDEPTAGLDGSGRAAVLLAVTEMRRDAGVVVVTHDPEEWLGVADTVLVLSAGSPVFSGPAAELLADPGLFGEAGLCPPPVLEAQYLARARGLAVPFLSIDPAVAAEALASASGGRT